MSKLIGLSVPLVLFLAVFGPDLAIFSAGRTLSQSAQQVTDGLLGPFDGDVAHATAG
jgi:hypothetical protein